MNINFINVSLCLILCGILICTETVYSQVNENFKKLADQYYSGLNLSSVPKYWTTKGLDNIINGNIDELTSKECRLLYSLIDIRINSHQQDYSPEQDIFYLINYGLADKESANVYHVINILKKAPTDFFNQASINRLSNIIVSQECAHLKELIILSGTLNIQSLIPFYQSILEDKSRKSVDINWTVRLVLGKMGNANQVRYCIDKVRSIGINDEVVFYLVPDLQYVNNRLVYDFLLQEILSTSKNCHSTNPDNPVAIPCAYRLIESIAPFIMDFPVEYYESGDIVTDNYETMLTKVQQWIKENINTYQLKPSSTI